MSLDVNYCQKILQTLDVQSYIFKEKKLCFTVIENIIITASAVSFLGGSFRIQAYTKEYCFNIKRESSKDVIFTYYFHK